jgi:hypothetical protein
MIFALIYFHKINLFIELNCLKNSNSNLIILTSLKKYILYSILKNYDEHIRINPNKAISNL